jgi:cytochrome c-type protein NapC
MSLPHSPLGLFALACAVLAAVTLIAYLVKRPALGGMTRLWLLIGLGVLPISSATTGNIEGYERTKQRSFCGGCHVMTPYTSDAADPASMSLAARHSRVPLFGDESCYTCHADYGMYGTVTTKYGGLKHVFHYYDSYVGVPFDEAKKRIHLYKPMPNATCMHCHSTTPEIWKRAPDHVASLDDVRSDKVSCASGGCHGYAHPFTKPPVTP